MAAPGHEGSDDRLVKYEKADTGLPSNSEQNWCLEDAIIFHASRLLDKSRRQGARQVAGRLQTLDGILSLGQSDVHHRGVRVGDGVEAPPGIGAQVVMQTV